MAWLQANAHWKMSSQSHTAQWWQHRNVGRVQRGLWLLSPAITGRLRSSPGPPWVHPNCATGGNKGQLLRRGLKVEFAPPRGHYSPEPAGMPQSLITMAWQSKPPPALIKAVPKWRGKRSNARSSSIICWEWREGTHLCLCAHWNPGVTRTPPRQCWSMQQLITALGLKAHVGFPFLDWSWEETLTSSSCWKVSWHGHWADGSSGIRPKGDLKALICSLWIQEPARSAESLPNPPFPKHPATFVSLGYFMGKFSFCWLRVAACTCFFPPCI